MNCAIHPDRTAAGTCISCQRPVCAECSAEVAGHTLCPTCLEAAQQRIGAAPPPAPADVPFASMGTIPSSAPSAIAQPTPSSVAPPATLRADAPGLGKRLLTALLWGGVYGQWWALWIALSGLIFVGLRGSFQFDWVVLIGNVLFFGLAGILTGVIVAFTNGKRSTGGTVGIVVGIALCGLEMLLARSAFSLFNIFFFFVTGRFVGSGLAGRVWRLGPDDE